MKRYLAFIIALMITAFMFMIGVGLTFGAPAHSDMDNYFIEHGQEQIATNNIVTTVVFDYRGFDTLGESTVLFTAVIGVAMMFRRLGEGDR
jgi:multisubunit Na+/H+ antiporter MnhB subunit